MRAFLLILLPFLASAQTGGIILNASKSVQNIESLRLEKGRVNGQVVALLGYYSEGDGGGQMMYWDSLSTETDNFGTIIKHTASTVGRWKSVDLSRVGVRHFGAKGDGVTNDQIAFERALAAATPGGYVYIPECSQSYLVDSIKTDKVNFYGDGKRSRVKGKWNKGTFILPTGGFYSNTRNVIRDIAINGKIGVENCSGWTFRDVLFECDSIGVYWSGGQYRAFENCEFNCQWFAVYGQSKYIGYWDQPGATVFTNCRMGIFAKGAGVYYKDVSANGGLLSFRDCYIEGAHGFGVFLDSVLSPVVEVKFDNCWFEANGLAGQAIINGVTYTDPGNDQFDLYMRNSVVNFYGTPFTGMQVRDNSRVHIFNSKINAPLVDTTSIVLGDWVSSSETYCNSNILINSIASDRRNSGYNSVHTLNGKLSTLYGQSGKIIYSNKFNLNTTYAWGTDGTSQPKTDGLTHQFCQELVLTGGSWRIGSFTVPANKWIVWTTEIRQVSGALGAIAFRHYNANLGSLIPVDYKWHTYATIFKNPTAVSDCRVQFELSTGTVRIGATQMLAFDTEYEALSFINSHSYAE